MLPAFKKNIYRLGFTRAFFAVILGLKITLKIVVKILARCEQTLSKTVLEVALL